MDSQNIVLIIGAGASKDLDANFGLGCELIQQISDRVTDRTSNGGYLSNLLNDIGFNYSLRWDFVTKLDSYIRTSEFPSIDGFLDEVNSYPEYESVKGKFTQIAHFAIVFHILGYEGSLRNRIEKGEIVECWISDIIKFIDAKRLLELGNKVFDLKIINFNYDRTLEHILYLHYKGHKEAEISNFINNSIIHIYGKIGNLLWQSGEKQFDFGEDNNNALKIFKGKMSIQTIYSHRQDNRYVKISQDLIHNAETTIVGSFGFSFDLMNYRRLKLQTLENRYQRRFLANIFPLQDPEFKSRRAMAQRIRNMKHDSEITYLSCSQFLKKILLPDV